MVDARNPYTGGHLWRVSQFTMILAGKAGLPASEVQRIAMAGLLHDLGKIGIPDAILGTPGRLAEEVYEVIKTHPRIGSRTLAGHPLASAGGYGVADSSRDAERQRLPARACRRRHSHKILSDLTKVSAGGTAPQLRLSRSVENSFAGTTH